MGKQSTLLSVKRDWECEDSPTISSKVKIHTWVSQILVHTGCLYGLQCVFRLLFLYTKYVSSVLISLQWLLLPFLPSFQILLIIFNLYSFSHSCYFPTLASLNFLKIFMLFAFSGSLLLANLHIYFLYCIFLFLLIVHCLGKSFPADITTIAFLKMHTHLKTHLL